MGSEFPLILPAAFGATSTVAASTRPYAARWQARLPAKLADAPAFSPQTGALPAAFAAELDAADAALVALSGVLRTLYTGFAEDTCILESASEPPTGAAVADGGCTFTITAVAREHVAAPSTWRLTCTDIVAAAGLFLREGEEVRVGGVSIGTAITPHFAAGGNPYLAGVARLVGWTRTATENNTQALGRVEAAIARNTAWGRLEDLLTIARSLLGSTATLDDGGETRTPSTSVWGTGRVGNGAVLVEATSTAGVSDTDFRVLSQMLRASAPAGVRVLVGALRTEVSPVFRFGSSSFGDGSVLYSLTEKTL